MSKNNTLQGGERVLIKKLGPIIVAADGCHGQEGIRPSKEIDVPYTTFLAWVLPGESTKPHHLEGRTEVYYIQQGIGQMHVNNEQELVREQDHVVIPPGAVQYIENVGGKDLVFLCIVTPPWTPDCERSD